MFCMSFRSIIERRFLPLGPKMYHLVVLIATFLALAPRCRASGEKLSMTIHQSGFHRTLRYDTYFLQPWQPEPCDFCLEQTIPAGAYVDTDQLDDLMRMDKLNYYTGARVNVEAMASKSEPFRIYLFGDSTSRNTIHLPVHFRYHLAGDQSFVRVQLDPPLMYMNCSEPATYSTSSALLPATVRLPCKHRSGELCQWHAVEYDLHSDPIVISLPIGSRAVEPLVTFVSIAIAWAACYYITLALYNKAKELEPML